MCSPPGGPLLTISVARVCSALSTCPRSWLRTTRKTTSEATTTANASHCLDQAWLAAGLGLASQVADVDVERVRREPEVVAPDPLEDQRPRQHLAGVEH